MSYKILSLKDKEEWDEYIHKLPIDQQDVYYTPEYYSLYEHNGDGKAFCFVYEENGNILLYPFLENSINALGYKLDKEYFDIQGAYGYNGIVSSCKEALFLERYYDCFEQYCIDNNIVAEFFRFHPILNNYQFNNHLLIYNDRKTVCLDLTLSYEQIWKEQYSTKNRNVIRKSILNGNYCQIIKDPSEQEINQFINAYERSMRAVNADSYYFFKKDYYAQMFKELRNNIYILFVRNKNREIACASVFFHCGNYFHYHLSGRGECADNTVNNLLLDEAIKLAQKLGAKIFHFGGGTTSEPSNSLLQFKSNFSRQRADFYIGKRIYDQDIYNQIVEQWKQKNSQSYEKNKVKLLGYREI